MDLNTLIAQASTLGNGVQTLAAALVEVNKIGRAGIIRARLIEAIEDLRPEAAAVVHAALDAAPEGLPFDYIGALIEALPMADRPTAELAGAVSSTRDLDAIETSILALEREAAEGMLAGVKAERIRALGLGPIDYYRRLNILIDSRAGLAADPVTVNRLRRLRDTSGRRRRVAA